MSAELAYAAVVAAKLRCGIEVPRANVVEALLYAVPAPDPRLPQASAPAPDRTDAAVGQGTFHPTDWSAS